MFFKCFITFCSFHVLVSRACRPERKNFLQGKLISSNENSFLTGLSFINETANGRLRPDYFLLDVHILEFFLLYTNYSYEIEMLSSHHPHCKQIIHMARSSTDKAFLIFLTHPFPRNLQEDNATATVSPTFMPMCTSW